LKLKGLTWKLCQTKRTKRDIWPNGNIMTRVSKKNL